METLTKELLLKQIELDPNQPRKKVNNDDLKELAESIKQHGVLQPIIVRPLLDKSALISYDKKTKNEKWDQAYMIISGERRFLACLEIENLKTIPAIIKKDLSDEDVLEIQIIENLQRKDIHPLEEGKALGKLYERLSMQEVAARVGKSVRYVGQRISLLNLIKPFQEIFLANKMYVKTALNLIKYSAESQLEIYEELDIPERWETKEDFINELDEEIESISYRATHKLSDAKFDLEDPDLNPDAPRCSLCQFNSASKVLLFPEEKAICHNSKCFDIKEKNFFKRKLEQAAAETDVIFLEDHYSPTSFKNELNAANALGLTLEKKTDYRTIFHPGDVPTWEGFLEEMSLNKDEMTEEEMLEAKEEFKEVLDEYNEELKEYEAEVKNAKKAFKVSGYDAGEYVYVLPIKQTNEGDKNISVKDQIRDLEESEEDRKVKDRQKIFKLSQQELQKIYKDIGDELHPEEWVALAIMISNYSYAARYFFRKELDVPISIGSIDFFEALNKLDIHHDGHNIIRKAIRIAIEEKLFIKNEDDYEKNDKAAALQAIAKVFVGDHVKIFEQEQSEIADKRIKALKAKIKSLKQKSEVNNA